jgi:hypothetical protein
VGRIVSLVDFLCDILFCSLSGLPGKGGRGRRGLVGWLREYEGADVLVWCVTVGLSVLGLGSATEQETRREVYLSVVEVID